MGPSTRSGQTPQVYLGYEPGCVGLVPPLNSENNGLFKQDLKEVTGKVRPVSDTQFSPRQHTKGLALLASDLTITTKQSCKGCVYDAVGIEGTWLTVAGAIAMHHQGVTRLKLGAEPAVKLQLQSIYMLLQQLYILWICNLPHHQYQRSIDAVGLSAHWCCSCKNRTNTQ